MPTGYTAILDENPDATFEQFALRCARAFGALITMRDDPLDAEIPEVIEPDYSYLDRLNDEIENLRWLSCMSYAERIAYGEEEIAKRKQEIEADTAKTRRQIAAYDKMAEAVEAWQPPSELESFREFMLSQLQTGRPFEAEYDKRLNSLEVWEDDVLTSMKVIKRYRDSWAEEQRRADESTAWLKALRDALKQEVVA